MADDTNLDYFNSPGYNLLLNIVIYIFTGVFIIEWVIKLLRFGLKIVFQLLIYIWQEKNNNKFFIKKIFHFLDNKISVLSISKKAKELELNTPKTSKKVKVKNMIMDYYSPPPTIQLYVPIFIYYI